MTNSLKSVLMKQGKTVRSASLESSKRNPNETIISRYESTVKLTALGLILTLAVRLAPADASVIANPVTPSSALANGGQVTGRFVLPKPSFPLVAHLSHESPWHPSSNPVKPQRPLAGIKLVQLGKHTPTFISIKHRERDVHAMQRARPASANYDAAGSGSGSHPQAAARRLKAGSYILLSPSTTGTDPWAPISTLRLPGIGLLATNLANGNAIVVSTDFVIPHHGVPLDFHRVFNSQSQHNYGNSDQSQPSQFGNGWTNNFDAHIVANSAGGISVYDGDGARYDYTSDGEGGWDPPLGEHNQLILNSDDGNYYWYSKGGVAYVFMSPFGTHTIMTGRLLQINGRNSNTYLTFGYSVDPGTGLIDKMNITTDTSDQLQFSFALFNGHELVSQVSLPDSSVIQYGYDSNANLTSVTLPSNTFQREQQYTYGATGQLVNVVSPRYLKNVENQVGAEGGYASLSFDGSNRLTGVAEFGVVNFTPADGLGLVLQSGRATGVSNFRTLAYTYYTSGQYPNETFAAVVDTDGHSSTYASDLTGRELTLQNNVGANQFLTTQSWDSNNNLIALVTPDGAETDEAYDANGNLIAVAQPRRTINGQSFRPTNLSSFDNYNNLIASCSPSLVHSLGLDWKNGGPTSSQPCPSGTSAQTHMFSFPQYEPYGELLTSTSPATAEIPHGVVRTVAYNVSNEGKGTIDFGLPTSVTDPQITQEDQTQIQPATQTAYDKRGNVTSINKGGGYTFFSYDSSGMGQLQTIKDADGYVASFTYLPNGAIATEQTPAGAEYGVSDSVTYDADGNSTSMTTYNGCTTVGHCVPATSSVWFDSVGRAVEAEMPSDPADLYPFPWIERSLYDLSGGSTVSYNYGSSSTTFVAHGNLFKSQRLLAAATINDGNVPNGKSFFDIAGYAYDSIDRNVNLYSTKLGAPSSLVTQAYGYDAGGLLGLPTTVTTAAGDTITLNYDSDRNVAGLTYNVGSESTQTPNKTFTLDADGNLTSLNSANVGSETFQYDQIGNLLSLTEAGSAISSPASYTYSHYINGWTKQSQVAASALSSPLVTNASYRVDGLVSKRSFNGSGVTGSSSFNYTAAGRASKIVDSAGTTTISYDSYGDLSSLSLPELTYSNVLHDPQGNLLSFVAGGQVYSLTYTTRGEAARSSWVPRTKQFADGIAVRSEQDCYSWVVVHFNYNACGTSADNIDALNGVSTGVTWVPNPGASPSPPPGTGNSTITYDAGGRQISSGSRQSFYNQTFDADAHLMSSTPQGGALGPLNFVWSPSGRVWVETQANPTPALTFHWAGRDNVATTSTSGTGAALVDLKPTRSTEVTGTNTVVEYLDRDLLRLASGEHDSSGHSAQLLFDPDAPCQTWQPSLFLAPQLAPASNGFTGLTQSCLVFGRLFALRSDSYSNQYSEFHTGRSYSELSSSFMSGDPLSGTGGLDSLGSAYSFGANNDISNADPTGLCVVTSFGGNRDWGTDMQQTSDDPTCQGETPGDDGPWVDDFLNWLFLNDLRVMTSRDSTFTARARSAVSLALLVIPGVGEVRLADKAVGLSEAAVRLATNASKGAKFESESLDALELAKNTEKMESSTGYTTIVDAFDADGNLVEFKSVANLYFTRQVASQVAIARDTGVAWKLYVDADTRIANTVWSQAHDVIQASRWDPSSGAFIRITPP